MNVHDWLAIVAAAVVVAGWFVNSWLNRRHEIAKKRMDYRLDALHSFVPVFLAMNEGRMGEPGFADKLAEIRTKFQLYCHGGEIDAFEHLVAAIERRDNQAFRKAMGDLARVLRDGVRRELGLAKYSPNTAAEPTPTAL
jgi:hypothetical protein